ncbi:methylated-DNA--[protein]-cysteine S-methyltransferase [Hyphococcus sp.]|uniref:methylated-DNA--[protein]-cysteine S-methyltransferase n=1 Tax=Hyphococcus sp. TaxID=2038636 RepID=UPI003CCB8AE6
MAVYSYLLFDTALGRCGLCWGEAGLRAVSFAHANEAATVAHLKKRARDAVETEIPPSQITRLIEDTNALFAGDKRDLSYAALDTDGIEPFGLSVIELTKQIGPGELKTYGDLARMLGDVGHARRVGQALGRNPFPIVVPCHRVVGANGAMTGFSAPGGAVLKRRL